MNCDSVKFSCKLNDVQQYIGYCEVSEVRLYQLHLTTFLEGKFEF